MDTFNIVCDVIITVAGLIPTVVSVILLIKNIIATKNWNLVVTIIQKAMTTAEEYATKHTEMTGTDKQEMALEAIKSACIAAGITLNEALVTKIVAYIKDMCNWSKTVNAK